MSIAGHAKDPFPAAADSAERNRLTRRWSDGWFCFLLLCLLSVLACMGYGFAVQKPSPAIAVENRINPNTATLGSLIRLEGIGPARAFEMIRYRQEHADKDRPAFTCPHDLQAIRGIGPKTTEKIAPYLNFETTDETCP